MCDSATWEITFYLDTNIFWADFTVWCVLFHHTLKKGNFVRRQPAAVPFISSFLSRSSIWLAGVSLIRFREAWSYGHKDFTSHTFYTAQSFGRQGINVIKSVRGEKVLRTWDEGK